MLSVGHWMRAMQGEALAEGPLHLCRTAPLTAIIPSQLLPLVLGLRQPPRGGEGEVCRESSQNAGSPCHAYVPLPGDLQGYIHYIILCYISLCASS